MNLPVNFIAVSVLAIVTGSNNDDNACINELARSPAHGVVLVGVNRGCAQTHVDDANIVLALVGRVS